MKEILLFSYYEHFKALKELSKVLPTRHPKIIALENECNKITQQLSEIDKI